MATKPTKWEMPLCPYCRVGQLEMLTWGNLSPIPDCPVCNMARPDCFPPMIQGSAPPFVPMSEKRFPVYGNWRDPGSEYSLTPCMAWQLPGESWPARNPNAALIERYETRLAHLCGLIVSRHFSKMPDQLMQFPVMSFDAKRHHSRVRTRIALMLLGPYLDARFAASAVFSSTAKTHILQPKYTALLGAALRGKA